MAIRLLALLVLAFLAAVTVAAGDGSQDDLLAVLAAGLYPVEVMAYCHREVAADPAVQAAGEGWSERNGPLLAALEGKAAAAGVADAARRQADQAALAAIEVTVAGQADKPAYCRLLARIIDAGYYDIDQRDDLKPALKGIFGEP